VTRKLLTTLFGSGPEMDAYVAASTLPNLFMLVAGNAFSIVFVPLFIDYRLRRSESEAWDLANCILTHVLLWAGLLTAVGLAAAPQLVSVLAPGFAEGTLEYGLAVTMLRVQWPIVLFSAAGSLLVSLHLAQQRYGVAGLAPLLSSLLTLVGTVSLYRWLGIVAAAVGSLGGPLVQALLYMVALRSHLRLRLDPRQPGLAGLARPMLLWTAAALISRATRVVDANIGSRLVPGSLSYLEYAWSLVFVANSVLARGVSLTTLPRLAEDFARSDTVSFGRSFSAGVRGVAVMVVPAVAAIVSLGRPALELVFKGGRFDARDTYLLWLGVVGYSGALVATSVGAIVSNALYARREARTAATVGVVGTMLYVPLAWGLTRVAEHRGWPAFLGLAVAYSLLSAINLTVMTLALRRRVASLGGIPLGLSLARIALAGLAMALTMSLAENLSASAVRTPVWEVARLTGAAMLGAGVFVGLLARLGSAEVALLRAAVLTPLSRRRRMQ
jgi:putative peptidoglycan lipid II flippase